MGTVGETAVQWNSHTFMGKQVSQVRNTERYIQIILAMPWLGKIVLFKPVPAFFLFRNINFTIHIPKYLVKCHTGRNTQLFGWLFCLFGCFLILTIFQYFTYKLTFRYFKHWPEFITTGMHYICSFNLKLELVTQQNLSYRWEISFLTIDQKFSK